MVETYIKYLAAAVCKNDGLQAVESLPTHFNYLNFIFNESVQCKIDLV